MDAPTTAQKLCDTSDMVIVHRMFRRECALLPKLVAAVTEGDIVRARNVAGHAREVLDMLHHHHVGEDELLWPRLSARTRFTPICSPAWTASIGSLRCCSSTPRQRLSEWQDAPIAHTSTPLTTLLEQLSTELNVHFDEEEAKILPIVERVLTAVEYEEVGRRGLVSIPITRRLIVLGYLLEDATPEERTDFLAAIPRPVRIAYRLIGRRQHRNETTRLRGPLQA